MSGNAPFLSVVVTGRHDNYAGDSRTRFLRTLRFNLEALRSAGVASEIVLVEWNPIRGRPTLFDITREQLAPHEAASLVGYIVAPEYHEALTQNPTLNYLEYIAKNVGIRRARGAFVLASNIDIYLGRGVVDWLAGGALEAATVYRAPRVDLVLSADQTRVTWDLLEHDPLQERRPTLRPPLFAGGSGDFVLIDREGWSALRGFNEVYRVARAGIDHNLLVKAFGCGLAIQDVGHPVYHVNHAGSFRISKTVLDAHAANTTWGKRRWHSRSVVYDNPDDWGLRRAPERSLGSGATMLEFDWGAVPPLVDLRRVVVPMRRSAIADSDVEGSAG